MDFDQGGFDVRFEWGLRGVEKLAPTCDALVIVDVLSFSTCVDIAVSMGVRVLPYEGSNDDAAKYAGAIGAALAGRRGTGGPSLSPGSLQHLVAGTSLVLPSPNGSSLSLSGGSTPVLTGCLRNAKAVAAESTRIGRNIGVIAAGERWREDQSLRPALEDLLGAGAIIEFLSGAKSPEAAVAAAAFRDCRANLNETLRTCLSGKELIDRGFADDVQVASHLNTSLTAPILMDSAFVDAGRSQDLR